MEEYLIKRQEELDDTLGKIFESILAKAILTCVIDEKKFTQFILYPKLVGVSGSANQPYKSNPIYFFAKNVQMTFKEYLMRISMIR